MIPKQIIGDEIRLLYDKLIDFPKLFPKQDIFDKIYSVLNDMFNLMLRSLMRDKYRLLDSIIPHKTGGIARNPELSLIGEKGPEAIIPLVGSNKRYGKEILSHILPRYFPEMIGFRQ